ncbi:hypothetical protein KCU90_g2902, partial [Aureobasidium melanogenum]
MPDPFRPHFRECRGRPAALAILVDQVGPHAFAEIAFLDHPLDDAQFHPEALREAHLPAAQQCLARDIQHRGRMPGQRVVGRLQPLPHLARRLALQIVAQRRDNPLDARTPVEVSQDQLGKRPQCGVGNDIARRLEHAAQRTHQIPRVRHALQALFESRKPIGRHAQIRELQAQRIGAGQGRTGEPDVKFDFRRHHAQKPRRANVGQEADARFRHRDLAALRDNAQPRPLTEPHAAAHRNTVEQGDHRLRKPVQRIVEPVFVDEKRQPAAIAILREPVHLAHVAARAKTFGARAFQHEGNDAVVGTAMFDQYGKLAHHCMRQRIERGRPVQRNDRHTVDHAKQNLALRFRARIGCDALQSAHRRGSSWRAFLEKCIDAFTLIGAVEQIDKAFPLHRERRRARHAVAALMNQRLAEADRLRAQGRDTRGHAQRGLACSALVHHFFDEADTQGGLRIHPFAGQDHPLGPAFADQPGQRLRAAAAGQQAHRRFRQRHHRVLLGDADIAGQRAFEPAAHRITVDRRDHHRPRVLQGFERRAEARRRCACDLAIAVGERVQIGARAEELGTVTAYHDGPHARFAVQTSATAPSWA